MMKILVIIFITIILTTNAYYWLNNRHTEKLAKRLLARAKIDRENKWEGK